MLTIITHHFPHEKRPRNCGKIPIFRHTEMGGLSGTQIFGGMLGGTSFPASPTWVDRSIENSADEKTEVPGNRERCCFSIAWVSKAISYLCHMTKYDQLIHLYTDFPWHKPWHISVLMTKSSMDGFSMRFLHDIRPCQLLWYPLVN